MPSWTDVAVLGPTVAVVFIFAVTVIKIVPAVKEVRLAELRVRELEANIRREEAISVGRLTEVFKTVSETTEELKIFLRASNRERKAIEDRLTAIEEILEISKEARG